MNWQATEPRVADEMGSRREHAGYRRCRRATYGVKPQTYWRTARRISNLLREFRRFDANEVDTEFFTFRDKLRPSHNTYNAEVARFCNCDQASRDVGIGRV